VIFMPAQFVEAPVMRVTRRIHTDMGDTKLGPNPIVGVIARLDLCADIHRSAPSRPSDSSPLDRNLGRGISLRKGTEGSRCIIIIGLDPGACRFPGFALGEFVPVHRVIDDAARP
jgi:hypothetical protein